jgi:hypothetical protein
VNRAGASLAWTILAACGSESDGNEWFRWELNLDLESSFLSGNIPESERMARLIGSVSNRTDRYVNTLVLRVEYVRRGEVLSGLPYPSEIRIEAIPAKGRRAVLLPLGGLTPDIKTVELRFTYLRHE